MDRWAKFGRWLETQRTDRQLSKTEACRLSGISPSSWYNLEHGGRFKNGKRVAHTPSTETLLGIARALKLKPVEVFDAADIPLPSFAYDHESAHPEEPPPRRRPAEPPPAPPAPSNNHDVGWMLAQLLAEQRELRATLQALRELLDQRL